MAVLILCQGAPILRVKNSTFEQLYNTLVDLAENETFISVPIKELIDDLYTGCHGIGNDIANFLKTPDDAIFFAQLVKETVQKMQQKDSRIPKDTSDALTAFYETIFEYAKYLKNKDRM